MTLKSKTAEFIAKKDLIPKKLKWERNVDGIARIYCGAYSLLDSNGKKKLVDMLYDWGFKDSDEVVRLLGINRDLHGCAIALITANHAFAMKSHIVKETEDEIVIHVTDCRFKDRDDWTSKHCVSIDRYDHGLIEGINKNVKLTVTKRRSKGDDVCEAILKKKETHK